jgi:phosphoglucosamine mutase
MLAGLQIMSIMLSEDQPLSRLAGDVFERVPQVLINVMVREKPPIEDIPEVQKAIDAVTSDLGKDGRVLVRYSGTEPKARVMIEGPDAKKIQAQAESIVDAFRKTLGQ